MSLNAELAIEVRDTETMFLAHCKLRLLKYSKVSEKEIIDKIQSIKMDNKTDQSWV